VAALIPDWMSKADQHRLNIESLEPVPWEHFCDNVRLSEQRPHILWKHARRRAELEACDQGAVHGKRIRVLLKATLPKPES
jgi:hypothetical protein